MINPEIQQLTEKSLKVDFTEVQQQRLDKLMAELEYISGGLGFAELEAKTRSLPPSSVAGKKALQRLRDYVAKKEKIVVFIETGDMSPNWNDYKKVNELPSVYDDSGESLSADWLDEESMLIRYPSVGDEDSLAMIYPDSGAIFDGLKDGLFRNGISVYKMIDSSSVYCIDSGNFLYKVDWTGKTMDEAEIISLGRLTRETLEASEITIVGQDVLLISMSDGKVLMWDANTHQNIFTFSGKHEDGVMSTQRLSPSSVVTLDLGGGIAGWNLLGKKDNIWYETIAPPRNELADVESQDVNFVNSVVTKDNIIVQANVTNKFRKEAGLPDLTHSELIFLNKKGKEQYRIELPKDLQQLMRIYELELTDDNKLLLGMESGEVLAYDIESKKLVGEIGEPDKDKKGVTGMQVLPNNQLMVTYGDNTVAFFDE